MSFKKLIRASSFLFLLFSLNVAADAQGRQGFDSRWEQIGRSYVDGRRDHDTIAVNNAASYRALVLEVRGGTVEFQRVIVHFDNGADHEMEIRDRITDGRRTRVIDLPGERRRIRSVEFWYTQDRWRSRPYVNLLGQRGLNDSSDDQGRRDDDGRRGDTGRWEQLGRAYVDGRRDHDTIAVNDSSSFRALQLEVIGGPIQFERVVVHFDNGADHELEIRDRIANRGKTRVIDLPGERRRIRSVEFWYSRGRWTTRPYVNLLGQRGFGTGPGDGRPDDDRWEMLGQAHVDAAVDHDTIVVNNQGSFRALQLSVKGGTIEFQRVVVHFESGADHQLNIRQRIDERERTRAIDLPGARRRIRSVEFWYSKENWSARPFVNLWGLR